MPKQFWRLTILVFGFNLETKNPVVILASGELTKVKLAALSPAALSPAALTIGCEVRQKIFEMSRSHKQTIFFTAMDSKATSERLETFFNEKNHIEMQNTPPKQENNNISMDHKTENQPFLPQFYTFFGTTHEHLFYITVFGISYRFHICQKFEKHFSGSRDFVRNAKHAFYAQTTSEADISRLTT